MAKAMDLIGKKYGRLTVVGLDEEKTKEKKKKYWLCKCECGNEKSISHSNLQSGCSKSCGCLRKEVSKEKSFQDLTGVTYGRLTALKLDNEKNKNTNATYWICKCKCGNIKSVNQHSLTSGETKSCGCLSAELSSIRNRKDLTGMTFERLTVLHLDEEKTNEYRINKKYRTYWICQCECGNIKSINGGSLKSGTTQSCGCLNKELASERAFKDLTGQRFGMLEVLKIDEEKTNEARKRGKYTIYYICKCDCGTIRSFNGNNFKNGKTVSCGCFREQQVHDNYRDLTGQRFGRLIVHERVYFEDLDKYKWKCRCDCGDITYVDLGNLTTKQNTTRSCGCLKEDKLHEIKKDIAGKRFGRLIVLHEDKDRSSENKKRYLICKCDCGNIKSVGYSNLISGDTMSCGCYGLEMISGSNSHMWKGGITPLSHYLRDHIQEWKSASLENANYRCVITNSNKDLVIHHIYPFNKILKETLEELNMPIKEIISDYSKEDLELIESKFLENHFKYGYGVVMEKELHIEFHSIYGMGNYGSKPPEFEEWEEFYNNKVIC